MNGGITTGLLGLCWVLLLSGSVALIHYYESDGFKKKRLYRKLDKKRGVKW